MKIALTETIDPVFESCLVVGVFLDELPPFLSNMNDKPLQALIKTLQSQLKEPKDMLWQTEVGGYRLLVVSFGKKVDFQEEIFRKTVLKIYQVLNMHHIPTARLVLPTMSTESADWHARTTSELFASQSSPGLFKTMPKEATLQSVSLYIKGASLSAVQEGLAAGEGVKFTKYLANLPSNHCTPRILAEKAEALSKEIPGLKIEIFDEKVLESLGMGAFLAVAKGSSEPPRLIQITWQGSTSADDPVVLVGKGITFDAGGISLKQPAGMEEMKFDMGGAATVLGVMKAAALLKLPLNIIGLLACAENMPGPSAVKPGDIVTSMSKKTIEIVNTDAEGRLVLADALTYAERFNPKMVIDIATLTGAVIVALGTQHTGLMTKDEELAALFSEASQKSGDTCWRLPLDDAYQDALKSQFADILNAQFDRMAGSTVAGCFLAYFATKYPWVHLDIAGTAWVSGNQREATGRPVLLLLEVLRHVAKC